MGYFPFFIDIAGRKGLIAGGGRIAAHKIEKLLEFEPELTVVSPSILPELLADNRLCCEQRAFQDSDIEGAAFVIAATDDEALNGHISKICQENNILVNVVDDKERCGFLFPSLVKEGRLCAGISTGGASPQAAATLRSQMAAQLPDDMEAILDYLAAIRKPAKEWITDAGRRRAFLKDTASLCLSQGRALTWEETEARLAQYADGSSAQTLSGVTLVGAGCGAYDLMTIRGLNVLRSAEVLIYDDLLDERLLAHVSESCEQIYVGKRDGRHSMKQEEINALLVEKGRSGRRVVRLKGGDSFVFGRGGEEVLALREAGIPVRVVPGVSSCIAVPEQAGIPVTHRGLSGSFHVMTGHTAATQDGLPEESRLRALAALDGTYVFLMGFHRLEAIADKLMEYGKPAATPVAVIHGGQGAAHTKAVRGTLADIAAKVQASDIETPAVIVIGDTAGMELL